MNKGDIKSLPFDRLAAALAELGEPKYRAQQIFKWLHLGVFRFEEMTDLPKALRARLDEIFEIYRPVTVARQPSALDGTVKYLYMLKDKNAIETVLMAYEHGLSVCISTQAGCKMGCVFCASYEQGRTRNLTAGEMLDQVMLTQLDAGRRISNIVLMGTGEPLDNFDSVMDFLSIVSDPAGINIGMRHISLSTCGLVPQILQLAEKKLQLTLSVSLHAPFDELRSRIMPINRAYDIASLMRACDRYFELTGRRISFEYAMIKDLNDTDACANGLAKLLKGKNCHLNLIRLNRISGSALEPSDHKTVARFCDILKRAGINVTVRRGLGRDIDASCGQLRRKMQQTDSIESGGVGLNESMGP